MVAHKNSSHLRVDVYGNEIIVEMCRYHAEYNKFVEYSETVDRLWDALSAIKGCRFNKKKFAHEQYLLSGRSNAKMEVYTAKFEVFTVAEVQARSEMQELASLGIPT